MRGSGVDPSLRIEALEAQLARLRDRIEELEDALGINIEPWFGLGLSRQESRLFAVLMKRDSVTREQGVAVICGADPDDRADPKIIDVLVCRLRRKLRPYGIQIGTIWGQGHRIDPHSKENARALIRPAAGAQP
jgi:two-component system cell cycle response regulator CtrA